MMESSALGCVIRGETSHYDIVAGELARALMEIGINHRVPMGNGILTVDNADQAAVRAALDRGDKGGAAAKAVIALLRMKMTSRPRVNADDPRVKNQEISPEATRKDIKNQPSAGADQ